MFIVLYTLLVLQNLKQTTVDVALQMHYGGQPLVLNAKSPLGADGDSVSVTALRFYIGHIQLLQDGEVTGSADADYYLVDAAHPESLHMQLHYKKSFNAIAFTLGVDAEQNQKGAADGALDPIHGMYWTWQSGYINAKIEGYSNVCATPDKSFQMHVGGFKEPYSSAQRIQLNCNPATTIHLQMALESVLQKLNTDDFHNIMSPGADAYALSLILAQAFTIAN